MDDMPPEALLEMYPPPMREIAERLRAAVGKAIPDVVERVRPGWHLIGYDLPIDGRKRAYFAYVAPESEHVHLGFEYGVTMEDPERLLQGEGITRQVRWLTFRQVDEIDDGAIDRLIHEGARVATMSRSERALRQLDREARVSVVSPAARSRSR